jgi:uncharacterized lipoprotein YmbA
VRTFSALIALAGCSLLPASAPPNDRYFTPELTSATVHAPKSSSTLRLGPVSSTVHTKIVHRDSATEVGMYDTLRWADEPEVFVREALRRALFDRGALRESDDDLPTLDVDVLAFEEVRHGSARSGRVQLRWRLHDDKGYSDGLVTSEVPAKSSTIDAIVEAISDALAESTEHLASEVATRLR